MGESGIVKTRPGAVFICGAPGLPPTSTCPTALYWDFGMMFVNQISVETKSHDIVESAGKAGNGFDP
jgi:hypothetical protein